MDIPIPSHGEPMRVSWGAAVAQSINALRSIGGDVLVTDSPQGSGDRSLPRNLRDRIKQPIPWTFSCDITRDDNGYEVSRSGGWANCRAQIGLNIDWGSKDVLWPETAVDESQIEEGTHWISGTETTADGNHALKVTLGSGANGSDTAKIVVMGPNDESDPVAGILYIRIGTVTNGKLIEPAPHINPVIYKYL